MPEFEDELLIDEDNNRQFQTNNRFVHIAKMLWSLRVGEWYSGTMSWVRISLERNSSHDFTVLCWTEPFKSCWKERKRPNHYDRDVLRTVLASGYLTHLGYWSIKMKFPTSGMWHYFVKYYAYSDSCKEHMEYLLWLWVRSRTLSFVSL